MSEENQNIMDWEKLTVPDLKSALVSRGMPTSGRKSELICRLKSTENKEIDSSQSLTDMHVLREETSETICETSITFESNGIHTPENIIMNDESMAVNISENENMQFLQNGKMEDINNIIDLNEDILLENDLEEIVEDIKDGFNENEIKLEDNIVENSEDINITENSVDIKGDENNQEDSKEKKSKDRMDIHTYRKDVKRRTVNIRNLCDDLNDDIREFLAKSEQYTLRFTRDHSPSTKKTGYADIKFATVEDAKEAIGKLQGVVINEKEVDVRHSLDELDEKPTEPDPKDLKTIYIGNLPTSATKEMLTVIFVEAKEIDMPLDNTGKPKGHAYLEFENEEEAKKALETYAGVSIDDGEATRQLKLLPAAESRKEKNKSRSRSKDKRSHGKNDSSKKSRNRNYDDRPKKHFKRDYDHDKYDRRNNRDFNRNPYNNYRKDWNSGPNNSMNQSLINRVNPQAAMNLLVGVSQLLSQQQQTQQNLLSGFNPGTPNRGYNSTIGGDSGSLKRRYEDRPSYYDRRVNRRGGDGGRRY
ncbi:uncharacterized protein LOC135925871 isoform X3 [Gordionus sp. m RMFG-2023]|uniref:uncharacterized protein LOC135925871 isoform X3 n=1 Tax=Gordionus sp. m RMFG-2023 TaxID=3053472 RepID=UPI0031FBE505